MTYSINTDKKQITLLEGFTPNLIAKRLPDEYLYFEIVAIEGEDKGDSCNESNITNNDKLKKENNQLKARLKLYEEDVETYKRREENLKDCANRQCARIYYFKGEIDKLKEEVEFVNESWKEDIEEWQKEVKQLQRLNENLREDVGGYKAMLAKKKSQCICSEEGAITKGHVKAKNWSPSIDEGLKFEKMRLYKGDVPVDSNHWKITNKGRIKIKKKFKYLYEQEANV